MSGPKHPAYLIIGTDRVQVDEQIAKLASGYDPDAIERWNAGTAAVADIVDACSMMALLASERLIIATGADAWSKKEDVDTIVSYLKDPSPDATLVLTFTKLLKASRIYKAVAKDAILEASGPASPAAAAAWAGEMFESLGATVSKKVISELVGITGFEHLDRLRTDIELIAAAAGSEPITSELVRELATHSDDMKIFAVTDAWATRNKSELLRIVDQLLQQNEKPVPLTIILGRHIAHVAKARRLLNHLPSGAVVNELTAGGANAWAAKKATEQAGRIGLAQAEAALARIAQLDYELKGGAVSINENSAHTIFIRGIAEL